MGFKVYVLCFCLVFATVRAIEVNLSKAWMPKFGWEFNCSWAIPPDDSLQSVGLSIDNEQFMIYRPKVDGGSSHNVSSSRGKTVSTNCAVSTDDRQKGTCVVHLEMYNFRALFFWISCEVSGERPYFRKEKKVLSVDGWDTVRDIEVNLSKTWKPNVGWEFNCSWSIAHVDSLHSVQLYRTAQQFMIYKPETDGDSSHNVSRSDKDMMSTNCAVSTDDRQKGNCVITVELYKPVTQNFIINCTVSGGKPYFRKETMNYYVDVFVPPSDAVITVGPVNKESGPVTLNCSASYLPGPPNLRWTIKDQQIPQELTGNSWNATSKLWHAWSAIFYAPSRERPAMCTAEIRDKGILVKGHAAVYNEARNLKGGVFNTIITVISLLLLI